MSNSCSKRLSSSCLMIHRTVRVVVIYHRQFNCIRSNNIIGCYHHNIINHIINNYTTSTIKYYDNDSNKKHNNSHTSKDRHGDHGLSYLDMNNELNNNADTSSNTINDDNSSSSSSSSSSTSPTMITNKINKSNKIKKTNKINQAFNIDNTDNKNDDKDDNTNVEIWDWIPPENKKNISTIISQQQHLQQRDTNMNTNYIIPRIEGVLLKPEEVQVYLTSQGAEKCIILNINGFAEFKYFVIATGRSVRHIRKMSESIVSTVSI